MYNKIFILVVIVLFVVSTVVVFNSDTEVKKVSFVNHNFVIQQENTTFENKDVDISLNNSQLQNQNINSTVSNVNISNSGNVGGIQNVGFKNEQVAVNSEKNKITEQKPKIKQEKPKIQQKPVKIKDKKPASEEYIPELDTRDKYTYQNVSWNEWKSNFINKILDDSMYLRGLDSYGVGSWFYYSFEVYENGKIDKIKIFSFYLKDEDKAQVRDMIQRYAYTDITLFPPDSKRKKAKVEAIVLLGETESKSKPSDFNDTERIKVKN